MNPLHSGEKCNVFRNDKWTHDNTTKVLNEIMANNVTHMDNIKQTNNLAFKNDTEDKKEKKYNIDKNHILYKPQFEKHKIYDDEIRIKMINELNKEHKKDLIAASHYENNEDPTKEIAAKQALGTSYDSKTMLRKMNLTRLIQGNTVNILRCLILNKKVQKKYCKM